VPDRKVPGRSNIRQQDSLDIFRHVSRGLRKQQRAAALQDLSEFRQRRYVAKRLGVRLPSAAFGWSRESDRQI